MAISLFAVGIFFRNAVFPEKYCYLNGTKMESLLLLKYPRGYFLTSKGQSRVHCLCEKWEDCPVYPTVAWRLIKSGPGILMQTDEVITASSENTISSDSISVLHFYAEVDPSTRVYY